jgi:hypothetical protein
MDDAEVVNQNTRGTPTTETADLNLMVAAIALAWLLLMLFWMAYPFKAIAVDPGASIRATLRYTGLWAGLLLPFIALLTFATFLSWRAGGRVRMLTLRHNEVMPAAPIIAVVAVAWLSVSVWLLSEPGSDFTLGLLWLVFSGMLALVWLVATVVAIQKSWKAPKLKTVARTLAYLVPFPAALILSIVLWRSDAPFETRFELSEGALTHHVDEFARTNGASMPPIQAVGLYRVGVPDRRDGCVRITTNSDMDYYAGLAHCDGSPPEKPNADYDHIDGRWWRFQVWH